MSANESGEKQPVSSDSANIPPPKAMEISPGQSLIVFQSKTKSLLPLNIEEETKQSAIQNSADTPKPDVTDGGDTGALSRSEKPSDSDDGDTGALSQSEDPSDDDTLPNKRSTVLTFGVSLDDERGERDTAILSENNATLRRAINNQMQGTMPEGTASLGNTTELILVIRGMIERVLLTSDVKYKLGRFDIGTKGLDEIDLTPYGALDRGVSRVHAEIFVEDSKLYIIDLDSTNGTYMAGARLRPHEPILLRKGDELILGRLPMQIMFRPPSSTSTLKVR